jgi:ferrous iron transport protein B
MSGHCHQNTEVKSTAPKVFLVGSPNVGKSAIFGLLTGRYVTVSNYPGTTVEVLRGEVISRGYRYHLIDTPGVNSLIPMSEDEKVTRDILLKEKAHAVVYVADSKNMRRSLFITLQLAEMGLPMIMALNMKDEATERGITIDEGRLEDILGIKAVSTVAVRRKGISTLKRSIQEARVPSYQIRYDDDIEKFIEQVIPLLPVANISRRSLALMILAGDITLKAWLQKNVDPEKIALIESLRDSTATGRSQPMSYIISQQRMSAVDDIVRQVMHRENRDGNRFSRVFGELTTHPVWGIFILVAVLYLVYQFVGVFGAGTMVDFLEEVVFGRYLNPWAEKIVTAAIPFKIVQELLIGPYGVITMAMTYAIAIILPITATFFIAFSIMEDSGYLPRLAAMLHKLFRMMGLNGKAVLPMVLGLGCDTMATLTTRILDTPKERLIVIILLALGVPCSAQLGVILGMFGKQPVSAVMIWGASLISVILFVGYISAKIIPGQRADFVLELPPIRKPQLSNILVKTVWRIEWYLKEAVPLFILGTLILFLLDKLGILPFLQEAASPVIVSVLGLPPETTASFIMGFLRRDYGAAGLFALQEQGMLNTEQVVVSLVTITLFVPCIANLFMIIKERGLKTALYISLFIFPFALLVGGILHRLLLWLRIFS